jgi:ornithine decarboxylase
LSRKFGTTIESARSLMLEAGELGLDPFGLSFHVGSQQTTPQAYEVAIGKVAMLFTDLTEAGMNLRMMNLGGGFPTRYRDDVPEIDQFGSAIMTAMTRHFGNNLPEMVIEPGRFIVGDAGLVQAEVVLVSRRDQSSPMRWVYLDIGRFGGLAETEGESIKYRITTPHDGRKTGPVAIAGPTCDGADIMYENSNYRLPLALTSGDRVELLSTGAYVTTYASTRFNGFAPLAEYYL